MKKLLLKIITATIVIGILAISFNTAFGNETITFLQKEQIQYIGSKFYIYKFNYWAYLRNLQLSTTDLSILTFNTPTREWITEITIDNWFTIFGNNLAVILDYIILIINVLLYPIKIGAYILKNMIAILGINTDLTNDENGLKWLIIFINNILGNIQIPYV